MTSIPKMEDFYFFTHAGCMDGSAAAILFMHAGGKKQNICWVPAGQVDEIVSKSCVTHDSETSLLFVDISPSQELARLLVGRGNVWIIDHHITAAHLNVMHPNFFVDKKNEACGSEHFRRWLVKNKIMSVKDASWNFDAPHYRRFCQIIDDHDRWLLKHPFSREMSKFFAFVGQQDFIERFMDVEGRFDSDRDSYWTPFEDDLMVLLRRIQERKYRATFEKMQVQDRLMLGKPVRVAYVISDEVNNSEMLNLYLNENPEVDVAVQISFGLQKVSLRSNDRIDVAAVAKQYGGGGHKNAAGHSLPRGLIAEIIGDIHAA